MFKTYHTILLFIILIGLVGCSPFSQTSEKDKEKNADDEQDHDVANVLNKDKEKLDSAATSDNKRIDTTGENSKQLERILKSTVKQIHATMSEEQDTHDWFMLKEKNPDKFKQELNRIKQPLSAFIDDSNLKQQAHTLLQAYTCYCDNYFIYEPKDTQINFEVTEKTDDTFKAETITLDDGYNGTGWTNIWAFEKEDDKWKLASYDYVLADEEPLHLTYEDIEDAYNDQETEAIKFLENVNIDDIPHIVIQRENKDIEIYNTKTGALNYTAMEEYTHNN